MRILITGATGLIGRALVNHFGEQHQFGFVGRDPQKIDGIFTIPHKTYDWKAIQEHGSEILADYDIVINLAGENIGNKRWSEKQKGKILNSRVEATTLLAKQAVQANNPSLRFLNASAVGIYDFAEDIEAQKTTVFNEQMSLDNPPQSFVAKVGRAWEDALVALEAHNLNVVKMRFGVVLAKQGGALKKLLPSFKLGLGAVLGSGQQPFSWIALGDLVRAIEFLMQHREIVDAINLVAPDVVSQNAFAKVLAACLHRPCFMWLPAFVVKGMFGEMAHELLLNGQNVSCQKLLDAGFKFNCPTINQALQHELSFYSPA